MIYTLNNVKLDVRSDESELIRIAERKLKGKVGYFKILKKSIDARDKENIKYVYSVEFSREKENILVETYQKVKSEPRRVMIVGTGPAGLFCAVRLIKRGIRPVLIERGKKVEDRRKDIDEFSATGRLNTESNVQFGEGGAGTFSDGKLNTQTNGKYNSEVLKTFVEFGAPKDILYLSKPHIGSDNLFNVVKNMREYIIKNGGEMRFSTKLCDIKNENGRIRSVVLSDGEEEVSHLVLALGHSARDTFEMLLIRGVYIEQKEFAVGVRIEHLQRDISFSQYGKNHIYLPPADYKLVSHVGERAAFSFCMCPGGYVMPAASEEGGVVVNGMSLYKRDGINANSALVVQVKKSDFVGWGDIDDEDPLAGVEYQRKIERAAFVSGGKNYKAPVQLVGDFLNGRVSDKFGEVLPTYPVGTSFTDLNEVLPSNIAENLKLSIKDMSRRLKAFESPYAVLSGVESRTSSPIRMTRLDNGESICIRGIYPIGEGAGYSGGITSSAADGLKCADIIADEYC